MTARTFKLASTALAALALAGCSMMPAYERPALPKLPQAFRANALDAANATAAAADEGAIQAAALGWQDYFADERLHRLIELALQNNSDLRTAALNVEAVRAQYAITRAGTLPSLGANAGAQRARVAEDLSATGSSYVASSYSVGLGITGFEIDLFGKLRSNTEAALQNYFATAASRDAAHLSLVAAIAKAHFNERYALQAMALAQNVLQTREKTYDLIRLKHEAGVVSAIDMRQQEALIESAKGDYASAVQAREQAQNALALLIAQPLPADLPEGLPLAQQFKVGYLPAGLPSEVLLNRPDIRAAEHALQQANANIGAARAAFFPSISLTTTIGTGSAQLGNLFDSGNRTWSFAPSISLPIFNWGALQASLDAAKIRQQIQVVNYESAVQSAFRDVADALAAREQLDKRLDASGRQSKAYGDALRLVRMRYQHGVASALDLLDAERNSYGADTAMLAIERTRLENLADLYKALGGGLKRHTADEAPSMPAKADAAADLAPAQKTGTLPASPMPAAAAR